MPLDFIALYSVKLLDNIFRYFYEKNVAVKILRSVCVCGGYNRLFKQIPNNHLDIPII